MYLQVYIISSINTIDEYELIDNYMLHGVYPIKGAGKYMERGDCSRD